MNLISQVRINYELSANFVQTVYAERDRKTVSVVTSPDTDAVSLAVLSLVTSSDLSAVNYQLRLSPSELRPYYDERDGLCDSKESVEF